jgi:hypothetical protein
VTLEQAARARKHVGKIGTLICILFFGAILDTCVARFREPLFTVHLLPGGSEAVEGQLDHNVKELPQMRIESPDARVRLQIDALQSGFWFGGSMWIGEIFAADDTPPGVYDIQVFALDRPSAKPVAAFRAMVYPDYAALRESFFSVIQRTFDIRPWMVAVVCMPVLGIVLCLMFVFSRRVERLLADQGRAEIFLVKKADAGFEVWFGLGERHGVEPGVRVTICAENGDPICETVVQRVDTENSMALADARAERLPRGAVVALRTGRAKQKQE